MDAFRSADEVLLNGVQGITDLITTPGLINVDFADVKGVMSGAGSALMGIGSSRGEGRAIKAAEAAINSPLLEASMEGARGVLLSIAGGSDLGLFEINEAASLVQEAAHIDANIIFGTVIDDSLGDEVRVTVIAAGFEGGTPARRPVEVGQQQPGQQSGQGQQPQQQQPAGRPGAIGVARAGELGRPERETVEPTPVRDQPPVGNQPPAGGGHAPRSVDIDDDGDDDVDVPIFMRR